MEDINPKNIVVIDESGSDLKMASDYARSQGGSRAKAPKPHVSNSKFSIIGAIGTTCIEAAMYVKEAVNLEIFETFVEKFLNPKLNSEKYVVMDNVNFHKNEKIVELIRLIYHRLRKCGQK